MSNRRHEFSNKVKEQAYRRAEGKCQKCGIQFDTKNRPEYDHIVMDAYSGDNSLANCQVLCKRCHAEKTGKKDIPANAKAKRLARARIGITNKGSLKRGKSHKTPKIKKTLPPRRGGIAAQFGLVTER